MTQKPEPRFKAGEFVTVVQTPYTDCPFFWIGNMDKYCGYETRIASVTWLSDSKRYKYNIEADGCRFAWCENCFETPGTNTEIEESDFDISVLFQ